MTEAQTQRSIIAPVPNPETESFWQATQDNKLMLGYCNDCATPYYYPRAHCPFCLSDQTELRPAKGHGTIHSFSVMRKVPVPYAVAYVELQEGLKILTNIVDCDLDAIRIGLEVVLRFEGFEGGKLPVFAPAG